MKKIIVSLCTLFISFIFSLTIIGVPASVLAADKPEKLHLAMITDMTGPYAATLAPTYAALVDAAQYVNERGGIRGVPIEIIARDMKGKVDIGIAQYMQLKDMKPRPPMIYGMFSPLGAALRKRFVEDKYPVLWSSSTAVIYPQGYAFGPFPTYADQCGLFIDWLAKTLKGKRARLAFCTWDTTFGKAVLGQEVMDYAKSKGIDVVATELSGVRDVAVTNQVMRIRAKKADWIYTNTLAHGPALIAKAANEMGYKVGLACGMGFDNVCIKLAGGAAEGFIAVHGAAHFNETDSKGVQIILNMMKKNNRPEAYKTSTYPISWAAVIIFKEIMERVIDKYGWGKVYDGPTIKKELQGLKDFAVLEDLWHFSYEPKRPTPITGKVFQVKNGKIVPLTGFLTMPDLRPAAYR